MRDSGVLRRDASMGNDDAPLDELYRFERDPLPSIRARVLFQEATDRSLLRKRGCVCSWCGARRAHAMIFARHAETRCVYIARISMLIFSIVV